MCKVLSSMHAKHTIQSLPAFQAQKRKAVLRQSKFSAQIVGWTKCLPFSGPWSTPGKRENIVRQFLSPLRSKPGKMPKHAHSASKKHNCISALSPHKFKVKKWEETKTVPQCRSCSAFKPTLRFTCINGDPSAKADLVAGPWNDTLLVSTYGCRQIFRSVGLMYILPPATLESNVFGIIKRFWQSGNPFMGLSLFSSPTSGLLWAS